MLKEITVPKETIVRQRISRVLLCVIVVACVAVLTGCAAKSPEDQIAETRTQYTVRLNTWAPRDPEPMVDEGMMEGDAMAAGAEAAESAAEAAESVAEAAESAVEAGEEMAEGEEEVTEADVVPQTRKIFFDLIVRFDGTKSLPGITVDITHADAFEKEKGQHRYWLDTAGMLKSDTRQIDFELEDVEFVDGDVFSVALRPQVPPEERGEYREFTVTGP